MTSSTSTTSTSTSVATGEGWAGLGLPQAAQPDIIRAAMKDDYCLRRFLHSPALDLALRTLGPQWAQANKSSLKLACDAAYFLLTTMRGLPTLGEEYCDLVQVVATPTTLGADDSNPVMVPPGMGRRVVLLGGAVLVPYLYRFLTAKLLIMSRPRLTLPATSARLAGRQRLGQLPEDAVYSPVAALFRWGQEIITRLDSFRFNEPTAQFLQNAIPQLRQALKLYKRSHLGLFYLFGVYYHISKRTAGIQYVFNRKVTEARLQYHVLGFMIFIQLGIKALVWLSQQASRRASSSGHEAGHESQEDQTQPEPLVEDEYIATPTCMLCMEPRKFATATPCGHLYCWYCIHDALKVKAQCPMCRHATSPNTLVRLHNYK